MRTAKILAVAIMAAVVGAGYLAAQEDATRPAGYGHRLALVRDRGKVLCADNTELAAWSWIDENGKNPGPTTAAPTRPRYSATPPTTTGRS